MDEVKLHQAPASDHRPGDDAAPGPSGGQGGMAGFDSSTEGIRPFRFGGIGFRLLVAFVVVVLLAVAAVTASSAVTGFRHDRRQAIDQLELTAAFKEAEISGWVDRLQRGLDVALREADAVLFARVILEQQPTFESSDIYGNLRKRLLQYNERTGEFEKLFFMDLNGRVVASIDEAQRGESYGGETFFREGLIAPSVSFRSSSGQVILAVSRPVFSNEGRTLGVFAGFASPDTLQEIMRKRMGRGETVKTYLVDRDRALLTEPYLSDVHTEGVDAALESREDGYGLYEDYRGQPVMGVYRWLPELQVALLAEQDRAEVFGPAYTTLIINGGVAFVSVLLAVTASLFITHGIARPLSELAETATQIAGGDLTRVVEMKRGDEIGTLANAFNSMTARLRELIGSLEQRVEERTRDLERRSLQLRTATEIARDAAATPDVESLLDETVHLISERFGFYHAGIFLLDDAKRYAVLRAASSEGGRKMLSRGHKLEVGEVGIVGYVTGEGEPRIALDVGEDAVFFDNPDLPETRSEIALPLKVHGEVIGALDVQSQEPKAFDEEDVGVLQTLADQVAVAISNTQLLQGVQEALEAERRAYGEVSREAWRDLLRTRSDLGFVKERGAISQVEDAWEPEMEEALYTAKMRVDEDDGESAAVPIKVRGHVIGVIDAVRPEGEAGWSSEQLELLETLAGRVGEALESARLYEDTQRRAARERLVSEVAARMRETLDLETMLKTAAQDIRGAMNLPAVTVRLAPREDEER